MRGSLFRRITCSFAGSAAPTPFAATATLSSLLPSHLSPPLLLAYADTPTHYAMHTQHILGGPTTCLRKCARNSGWEIFFSCPTIFDLGLVASSCEINPTLSCPFLKFQTMEQKMARACLNTERSKIPRMDLYEFITSRRVLLAQPSDFLRLLLSSRCVPVNLE